jgi:AbrB family looped-hinge helix DNA binding protein
MLPHNSAPPDCAAKRITTPGPRTVYEKHAPHGLHASHDLHVWGNDAVTEVAKGKFLYGTVTVGERGQIVLPKEARDHFSIKPGDKLIVTGDVNKGIAIVKAEIMKDLALKILGTLGESREERKRGE